MTRALRGRLRRMHRIAGAAARGLLYGLTLALAGATALAALGVLPWPHLALSFGESPLPGAGMWLQLGLTGVLALLCVALPPAAVAPPEAPRTKLQAVPEAPAPEAPPVFVRPSPVPPPPEFADNVVPLLRPAARTPAPVQPRRPGPRGRPP